MDYYLSLETCKQLKEWGCDVENSCCYSQAGRFKKCSSISFDSTISSIQTYDIRDIICNGEIAEAFFGFYDQVVREGQYVFLVDDESYRGCGVEGYEKGKKYKVSEVRYIQGEILVFLQGNIHSYHISNFSKKFHLFKIASLLQENNKEDAEKYILGNCVFNPKNK